MLDPLRRLVGLQPAASASAPAPARPTPVAAQVSLATDQRGPVTPTARGQVPATGALTGSNLAADVERLHAATLGRIGTDEATVLAVLTAHRSPGDRQALQAAFAARYGQPLEAVLRSELSLTYRTRALSLLQTGQDVNNLSSWDYRLEGALDSVDAIGTVFQDHPVMASLATGGALVVGRRYPAAMAVANYAMLGTAAARLVTNEVQALMTDDPAARREHWQHSGRAATDVALSLPGAGADGVKLVRGGAGATANAWQAGENSNLLVRAWRSAGAGARFRLPPAAAVRPSAAAAATTAAAQDASALPRQLLSQYLHSASPDEVVSRLVRISQHLPPEKQTALLALASDPQFLRQSQPEQLTRVLSTLGPAHTKLGQVAATQAGVPKNVARALSKLQDSLQPMTAAETQARMAASGLAGRYELGKVLGVASMGQVNEARNVASGERVVIKFLRPGVTPEGIRQEFALMREMAAPVLEKMPAHEAANWRAQLQSFEHGILEEADMTREARNMQEFAHTYPNHPDFRGINLVELGKDNRALVMTPADGISFKNLAEHGPDVSRQAGRAYMRGIADQIFGEGLYHADPHPGNVKFDAQAGQVEFMDMGAVSRVSSADRLNMQRMILFVLAKDADHIARQVMSTAERVDGVPEQALARYTEALRTYLSQPDFRMGQIDAHMQSIDRLAKANGIIPQQQGFWLTKTLITSYGVFRNVSGDPNVLAEVLPSVFSGLLRSFRENPASIRPTLVEACQVLGTNLPTFMHSLEELKLLRPGLFTGLPQDFVHALDAIGQAERAAARTARQSDHRPTPPALR